MNSLARYLLPLLLHVLCGALGRRATSFACGSSAETVAPTEVSTQQARDDGRQADERYISLFDYLDTIRFSPKMTASWMVDGERLESFDAELGVSSDRLADFGDPLTPHDFEAASQVQFDDPQMGPDHVDPIELADKFEGDIDVSNDSLHDHLRRADNAILQRELLWPNGVVPYVLSGAFTGRERAVIADAIQQIERRTCLRVRPRLPGESGGDYVHVVRGRGCSSVVGRQRGRQVLTLGDGCVYAGIVQHEFMHAVGFWHEQSRPDRDRHVRVHLNNVAPNLRANFRKYDGHQVQTLNEPYDLGSVMHYGKYAFALNRRRPTITALFEDDSQMGQRRGMSQLDVRKVRKLYGCSGGDGDGGGEHTEAPITQITTTTPPPISHQCRDMNENCAWWALHDECTGNPAYMHVYCRKSCLICSNGDCRDFNSYCDVWQLRGECFKNPSYMLVYCRRSCRVCVPDCTDMRPRCSDWARRGHCRSVPEYMLLMCQRACNNCR